MIPGADGRRKCQGERGARLEGFLEAMREEAGAAGWVRVTSFTPGPSLYAFMLTAAASDE
jgi:hypothetical protein